MLTKDEANKRLIEKFGLYLDGKPNYRIVWSSHETERRIGEHEIWYGEIFVRKEHGIREWPKYSYCPDRWILEVREPNNNPELTEAISYEPLYTFQDKHGNMLPLNWDVIEAYINARNNRVIRKPMDWKEEVYLEEQEFEKSKKLMLNKIKERARDNMDWKWQDKEAVFIPSTAKAEDKGTQS